MYLELLTAVLNTLDVLISRVFPPKGKIPMPFSLPAFPITCNIWRLSGAGGAYAVPDVGGVPCNLAVGERVTGQLLVTAGAAVLCRVVLLLPPHTDIRGTNWNGAASDLVECPAGSHRFYGVLVVDDYGKGFPNEHRFAVIQQTVSSFPFGFPFPVPLP